MFINHRSFLFVVFVLACFIFAGSGCSDVPEVDLDTSHSRQTDSNGDSNVEKTPLRVAVAAMISPKETRKYYDELMKLLGTRLGMEVELVQKRTYAEVNALIEKKKVDLAFVCSGPYVQGKERFGLELLVVPVVHGHPIYYSYMIAHRDSDINSLEDFEGKIFAFTDPMSNTGYLVPKYMIEQGGYSFDSFFEETFFTNGHDNSIKMVAEKVADGAAVDSLIWDYLDAQDSPYTEQTKIVLKSTPYGIPPVVVHPALPDEVKKSLKGFFLGLHEDPSGEAILKELKIQKFVAGVDSDYDSIREMERWTASGGKD